MEGNKEGAEQGASTKKQASGTNRLPTRETANEKDCKRERLQTNGEGAWSEGRSDTGDSTAGASEATRSNNGGGEPTRPRTQQRNPGTNVRCLFLLTRGARHGIRGHHVIRHGRTSIQPQLRISARTFFHLILTSRVITSNICVSSWLVYGTLQTTTKRSILSATRLIGYSGRVH